MSEAVITLHGLTKRFAGMDKPAVAPLDCTIHSGYVTGLVGPDGAGKTTLMRMLAGLLKADGGSASVLGFDPIQNDSELHAVLGYMPQKFGLIFIQTKFLRHITEHGVQRAVVFDRIKANHRGTAAVGFQ